VRELAAGLSEPWQQLVSSYATDDGERLLLFDPLALPGELEELAARRQTVIVLTAPWHERDAQPLAERLGLPVFAPPPDTQEDLMQKYGVTAEQAAGGSPDLAWLRAGDGVEGHFFDRERLAIGVEAFPGREHNDLVLWIEDRRAVISGDSLVDFGRGLEVPAEWLREGVTREQVAAGLRPLRASRRARARDARRAERQGGARARARLTRKRTQAVCRSSIVAVVTIPSTVRASSASSVTNASACS
jgi:glyoxylase-like metal-dependent hydrolase (beta-lactamase superfamily II)